MKRSTADREGTEAMLSKMDDMEISNLFWGLWNMTKHDTDFVNDVLDLIHGEEDEEQDEEE